MLENGGDVKNIFKKIIDRFQEKYPNNGIFVGGRSGNIIFKLDAEEKNYTIFILNNNGLISLAGYRYLYLDKDFLTNYYSEFKKVLKLDSLAPKDMGHSASYRVVKENPCSFLSGNNLEKFFELIDKLINQLLNSPSIDKE